MYSVLYYILCTMYYVTNTMYLVLHTMYCVLCTIYYLLCSTHKHNHPALAKNWAPAHHLLCQVKPLCKKVTNHPLAQRPTQPPALSEFWHGALKNRSFSVFILIPSKLTTTIFLPLKRSHRQTPPPHRQTAPPTGKLRPPPANSPRHRQTPPATGKITGLISNL